MAEAVYSTDTFDPPDAQQVNKKGKRIIACLQNTWEKKKKPSWKIKQSHQDLFVFLYKSVY